MRGSFCISPQNVLLPLPYLDQQALLSLTTHKSIQQQQAMTEATRTWSCLCGTFQAQVKGEPRSAFFCHCSRCRRYSGSVETSKGMWPSITVLSGGADNLLEYMGDDNESHFVRVSCKTCGGNCYSVAPDNSVYFVPLGALEPEGDAKIIEPSIAIFCGSAAGHKVRAVDVPQFKRTPK